MTKITVFDKVFIDKHNGNIYTMFEWVLGENSTFRGNSKYKLFVNDFIQWCTIRNKIFNA